MTGAATIQRMPPKKKQSGKNKTPRTAVQIPTPWIELARKIASRRAQPTVWYLIKLIEQDAVKEGMQDEVPTYPWEEKSIPDNEKP